MKTKDGTYMCPKCGREWHVLVNTDPLTKYWERFAPVYCPACGERMGDGYESREGEGR